MATVSSPFFGVTRRTISAAPVRRPHRTCTGCGGSGEVEAEHGGPTVCPTCGGNGFHWSPEELAEFDADYKRSKMKII